MLTNLIWRPTIQIPVDMLLLQVQKERRLKKNFNTDVKKMGRNFYISQKKSKGVPIKMRSSPSFSYTMFSKEAYGPNHPHTKI